MTSTNKTFHFEDLIIKTLKERKDLIGHDEGTDALVKFLVEIRESARRNENYEAYEHISDAIAQELELELKEETRIIARRK